MRVLRPTLYVLLVFSSALLFQCKDDENPDVEVSITADKTTVTFPAAGGNYEVKIASSGDWDVKEKIDWLAATKVNNTLLKVVCDENTGAERSDKVTATIEEESVEITVTQSADEEPSFGSKTIANQTYIENHSITSVPLPEAEGGNGDLTYSLTPNLATGLTFTPATRVLSGTPTAVAAEASYTYTATDEDNDAVTLEFTITVDEDLMPSFTETINDQTYIEGVTITTLNLPVSTTGNAPLVYTVTDLPDGLDFDANSRQISGTPNASTAQVATTYTYTVTDKNNDIATLEFDITIETDAMPTFGAATIANQTYIEGVPITTLNLPVSTTGNAPLVYTVTPDLPGGLSF